MGWLPKVLSEKWEGCGLKRIGACSRDRCRRLHPKKYRKCMEEEMKYYKEVGGFR